MASFLDVVRFNPVSNGTGSFVVSSAVNGYQTPALAGAVNGATYRYRAESADLTQWEVGYGVYTVSTTTLTRATILFNSSGGTSAINFTLVPQVAIVALAEDLNNLGSSGGFVNKFRNGTMDVWARGIGSMTITTAGAYTADGWIVTPTGASCTVIQVANSRVGANTLWGLQITGAASVTDTTLTQRIESSIAAALAGKTVTVQAQIANNTGGSITPSLTTKYAGTTDSWGSPVTDLSAANLQVCSNAVWNQVSYTFVVSSNAVNGYEFIFDFGNNFSSGAKSIVIAELDIRVSPNSLATGLNNNPPSPELRPVAIETQFCQRYFRWTTGTINTEPTIYGYGTIGQTIGVSITYPTQMFKAPVTSLTGTFALGNVGTPSINTADTTSYLLVGIVTSLGAVTIQPNGSARISFSAEL